MTLFNDTLRIKNGRLISLLPDRRTPATPRPGWTGPTRTWSLAYQAPARRSEGAALAQPSR